MKSTATNKLKPLLLIALLHLSISAFSADYYWVGGSGVWTDLTHWATTSGGTTYHTVVPTPLDNVIFDQNSFTAAGQTVVINFEAFCYSLKANNLLHPVIFDFNANLKVQDGGIDVNGDITWQQDGEINVNAGGVILGDDVDFTIGNYNFIITDGDLSLGANTVYTSSMSWNTRELKMVNGTLKLTSTSSFNHIGNGRFTCGNGDLIVPSGATLDLRAHYKHINNGSFKALGTSTVNLPWERLHIEDGGFEIDPTVNFTHNLRIYLKANSAGTYNIKSGGNNLRRIELQTPNNNAEYHLLDDLTVKQNNEGLYLYANEFFSDGYEIDVYHFYCWTTGEVDVDLTGTNQVKVGSQFRMYPSTNTTLNMGTADIVWEGTTHQYLFAGSNLSFNNLHFIANSTGSTVVHLEYTANIKDIVVDAAGEQYLEIRNNPVIDNFTWNYTKNTNNIPDWVIHHGATFNGTFQVNSSGSLRAKLQTRGSGTFNIFDIAGGIRHWEIQNGSTQTFSEIKPLIGTCDQPILINSSSLGSQGTISQASGTVTGDYLQLQDNAATGGATFNTSFTADLGNVTGWTIAPIPAQTFYWIGGSGNWSDPNNWSLSSGGVPYCAVPSRIDDVVFDANSFTASGQYATVDVESECHDLTWVGIVAGAGMNGNQILNIYGSIALDANMVSGYSGRMEMESIDPGETIQTNGIALHEMRFEGQGQNTGEWSLVDDLKLNNWLYVNRGTFNSNGQNLDLFAFRSSNTGTTVNFTGGTAEVKVQHQFRPQAQNHNMGIADVVFESSNQHMYFWYANGIDFNNVIYNKLGTSGHQVIIDRNSNNTFKDVTVNYEGSSWVRWDNNSNNDYQDVVVNYSHTGFTRFANTRQDTFQNISFLYTSTTADNSPRFEIHSNSHSNHFGNFILQGANDITPYFWADRGFRANNFTLTNIEYFRMHPSYTYEFDDLSITGNCLLGTKIYSRTGGSQVTVIAHNSAHAEGALIKDINATGTGTYTSANCTDGGNVTGWPITGTGNNLYWVGGAGNWNDPNHWSFTSGGPSSGCLPSEADNVFFDVNSFTAPNQTVNVNVTAYCHNMVWNNVNSPRIGGGSTLNIYGSVLLASNLTWNHSGWTYFQAREPGKTITTNGVQIRQIQFLGDGSYAGEWTLQDDLDVRYDMYVQNGSFISNGYDVSCRSFFMHNNNANTSADFTGTDFINVTHRFELRYNPSFTIGSADIKWDNMEGGYYRILGYSNTFNDLIFNHDDGANRIYLFNNSHNNTVNNVIINTTAYPRVDFYNNSSYNDISVLFNNNTTNIPEVYFNGTNTINVFNSTSIGNAGPYLYFNNNNTFTDIVAAGLGTRLLLGANRTQTVNGILALGNGSFPVIVKSQTDGTQATIFMPQGTVCLDFILLQDIKGDGPSDGMGGILTEFFAGASSVDLGNNTNWQFSSCLAYYWVGDSGNWSDYANHWATSSGGTFFHVAPPGPGDDVYFDANSFTTNGQTVNVDVANAEAHNLTWQSALFTPTLTGNTQISVYGDLELITFMNQNFTGTWNFEADDNGNIINSAGHSIQNANFNGGNDGEGEWSLLNILDVAGTINLNNGALISNNFDITAQNFNSSTANTRSLQLGSSTVTIDNGSWNPATLSDTDLDEGTSTIVVQGDGGTASFLGNGLTYNDVTLTTPSLLDVTLTGANTFNTLKIDPGITVAVEPVTQTMTALEANASCDKYINIESTVPGTPATFSQASGTVDASFLNLEDNTATGGATFNANFSNDNGGNTGWNFSSPPQLDVTVETGNVDCVANNDGYAEVTAVTGGTAPYTYLWSTTETTARIENLIPGSYSVIVSDASGCAVTELVAVVNDPASITPEPFTASDLDICLGTTINFTAGTPAEAVSSYEWNFGDFTTSTNQNPSHTYTAGGTYTVSLSYIDAGGCPAIVTEDVVVSDLQTSIASSNIDCFGADNGSIIISASGGVEPYQYSIDNGTTYVASGSFTGLTPGTYQVLVKDAIDCTTSVQTITLTEPASTMSFTVTATGVSCAENEDGSITFNASGGTPPYDYSINNGIAFLSTSTFSDLPFGTYNVVVRDDNNCLATVQVVNIGVDDSEAPTITCPANVTAVAPTGTCDAAITVGSPTVDDNCAVASVVNDFNNSTDASDTYPLGTTTVEWTVTDVNSNINTCSMTVTITDSDAPTASCQNVTVSLDANGDATVLPSQVDNMSSDPCGSALTFSLDVSSFTCSDIGDNPVTLTVTDVNNNSDICSATITVTAYSAPPGYYFDLTTCESTICPPGTYCPGGTTEALLCPAGTYQGVAGAVACIPCDPGYASNVQGATECTACPAGTYNPVSGALECQDCPAGTYNPLEAQTECQACTVSLTCAPDRFIDADQGSCEAANVVLASPTVTSPCSVTSLTNDAPAAFPVGATVVTWTVVVDGGATATCTQTITVNDTQDPTISCSGDISQTADNGSCDAVVSVPVPTFNDNCPLNPYGNALAFDGNNDYCEAPATVDNLALTSTATWEGWFYFNNVGGAQTLFDMNSSYNADGMYINLYLGNMYFSQYAGGLTQTYVAPPSAGIWTHIAVTKDGSDVNIYYNGVLQSETNNGTHQANLVNSTAPLKLGTQTSGANYNQFFNGRMDEVRIWNVARTQTEITDNLYNQVDPNSANLVYYTRFNQGVADGDNTSPAIDDLDDQSTNDNNGSLNGFTLNGSSSNWVESDVVAVNLVNSFNGTNDASDTYPVGTTTVTWTITDAAGNTAQCTQDITVTDDENPAITCPADITVNATSAAGAVVTFTDPVGTDNCTPTTAQTAGLASGATFPIGTTTNTFTVTDGAGNSASCSFDVTVSGFAPVISCPANITVNNDAGTCDAVVTFAATETTGIPASTITYSHTSGDA
ncbi:MAG: HYR domain-containing protein, partial [Bacteroidetes bacterium]